jgi:hypothetical protein
MPAPGTETSASRNSGIQRRVRGAMSLSAKTRYSPRAIAMARLRE